MMILLADGDPRVYMAFLALGAAGAALWFWTTFTAFGAHKVRERGVVVRGWWVQANTNLFEDGTFNWPAVIVFTFEQNAGADAVLRQVVADFARLKHSPPRNPVEAGVAIQVTNETFCEGLRILLPLEFTAGLPVYLAHVKVKRGLLRHGKITEPFARFKALPDENTTAVLMIESG